MERRQEAEMRDDSKSAALTEQDQKRYNRQMMIAGWGEEGQQRLKSARAFVAGAGGLGSPTSMYLAVAGVGRIALCDCDSPELSNHLSSRPPVSARFPFDVCRPPRQTTGVRRGAADPLVTRFDGTRS